MTATNTQHTFTPGPWHVTGSSMGPLVTIPNPSPIRESLLIAQCFNYGHGDNEECHERTLANARLIAASPTLYDYAMKQALGGCKEAISMLGSLQLTK